MEGFPSQNGQHRFTRQLQMHQRRCRVHDEVREMAAGWLQLQANIMTSVMSQPHASAATKAARRCPLVSTPATLPCNALLIHQISRTMYRVAGSAGPPPGPVLGQGIRPAPPWLSFDQSMTECGGAGAPVHTCPCAEPLRRAMAPAKTGSGAPAERHLPQRPICAPSRALNPQMEP